MKVVIDSKFGLPCVYLLMILGTSTVLRGLITGYQSNLLAKSMIIRGYRSALQEPFNSIRFRDS